MKIEYISIFLVRCFTYFMRIVLKSKCTTINKNCVLKMVFENVENKVLFSLCFFWIGVLVGWFIGVG